MNRKKYCSFLLCTSLLCSLTFFTGCTDPSKTGAAPAGRGSAWVPNTKKNCYWYRRLSARVPDASPTLDVSKSQSIFELINYALWNNPETRRTWADARAAAFNVGVEESFLYPTLELQENLVWIKQDGGGGFNSIGSGGIGSSSGINGSTIPSQLGSTPNYFNILITDLLASYLVLDFGGRCANIEAAKQALYASNWIHNRSLQTVIVNVIDAYYNQINTGAMYLSSLRTLEDAEVALDAAEKRYAAGVRNIADVFQARSSAAGAKLNVVESKGNFLISKGQLANALGLRADVEIEIDILPEHLEVKKVSKSIEQLMDVAKIYRPDLAAIYAVVQQKEAELKSAWSAGMPNVTANLEYENDYFANYHPFNGNTYSGTLSLNVPIFNGFFLCQSSERSTRKSVVCLC